MHSQVPIPLRDKHNYDGVIGERTLESGERQFLIKILGKPYKESVWISAEVFFGLKFSKTIKRDDIFPRFDSKRAYNPEFDEIETVLDFSKGKYAVKWKGLTLDKVTMQTYLPPKVFTIYSQRKNAHFSKLNKSERKRGKMLLQEESSAQKDHKRMSINSTINFLISNYNANGDATINVTEGTYDPMTFDYFCMELYSGHNDYGPYLVFTTPEKAEQYCKLLNQNETLTTLAYYGSDDALETADYYGFYDFQNNLKFHYIIITESTYRRKRAKIERLSFSVALYTDNIPIHEEIKSSFNIFLHEKNFMQEASTNAELCELLGKFGSKEEKEEARRILDGIIPFVSSENDKEKVSTNDRVISCPLSVNQKHAVISVLQAARKKRYIDCPQQLFLIAQHPFLINGEERSFPAETIKEASTKFMVCYELIKRANEKTCIVANSLELKALIEEFLNEECIPKSTATVVFENIPNDASNYIVFGNCGFHFNPKANVVRLLCSDCLEDEWNKIETPKIVRAFALAATMKIQDLSINQIIEKGERKLSSSLNEVIEDDEGFWKNFKHVKNTDNPRTYNKSLRQRELIITMITFLKYKWGEWGKIRDELNYTISKSQLRSLICSIISFALDSVFNDIDKTNYVYLLRMISRYVDNEIKLPQKIPHLYELKKYLPLIQNQIFLYGFNLLEYSSVLKPLKKLTRWWEIGYDLALLEGVALYDYDFSMFKNNENKCMQRIAKEKDLYNAFIERYTLILSLIANEIMHSKNVFFAIIDDALKPKITHGLVYSIYDAVRTKGTTQFSKIEDPHGVQSSLIENALYFYSMSMYCDPLKGFVKSLKLFRSVYSIYFSPHLKEVIAKNPWKELNGEMDEVTLYSTITKTGLELIKKVDILTSRKETKKDVFIKRVTFIAEEIDKMSNAPDNSGLDQDDSDFSIPETELKTIINIPKQKPKPESKVIRDDPNSAFVELTPSPPSQTYSTQEYFSSFPSSCISDNVADFVSGDDLYGDEVDMENDADDFVDSDDDDEDSGDDDEDSGDDQDFVEQRPPLQIDAAPQMCPLLSSVTFPFNVSRFGTLISPGDIVFDRKGFHSERYLYPSGYTASRMWKSTQHPSETITWKCEIVDDGGEYPLFRVSSDEGSFEGKTPIAPWRLINKKVNEINGVSDNETIISGVEMFLLSNNAVSGLLQQLPNAKKCSRYIMRNIITPVIVETKTVTVAPKIGENKRHHHRHHHRHHSSDNK